MTLHVPPQAYDHAIEYLQQGGVIAYPTEGVYGFGCDPFNESAVQRLLKLKQRSVKQGLILIAAEWDHVKSLTKSIEEKLLSKVLKTWPGPVTWVFPASEFAPKWICGEHDTIAIRVTDHPQAKELCARYGKPLVSTSANRHGEPALKDNIEVLYQWQTTIDYILPGRVGQLDKPTQIIDVLTQKVLRS